MWEGVGDRTELQHIDPTLMAISVVSFTFSRAAQPEAQGPSSRLDACFLYRILSPTGLISKLTDFLSSPRYITVQLPTQYLPITGHRDVSLPLSLEWHVWLSSSGNNCHAVHRSLFSGASVWLYRGILPCPILSAKPAYANGIWTFRVFGMSCLAGSKVNKQHVIVWIEFEFANFDTAVQYFNLFPTGSPLIFIIIILGRFFYDSNELTRIGYENEE